MEEYEITAHLADPLVKEQCTRDLEELDICFSKRAWKASVILAGSLIETFLFDVIKSDRQIPAKQRQIEDKKMSLFDLLRIARKYGVVNDAVFRLADQIRDYRNLIHPDVYVRQHVELNENIAQIAYSTVLEIARQTRERISVNVSQAVNETLVDIIQAVCDREPTEIERVVYLPIIEKYGIGKGRAIVERSLELSHAKKETRQ